MNHSSRRLMRGLMPTPSRPGFTLVELLLVIGLIVILLGLTLVVGGRIQFQAKTIGCMNNQRQVNTGNFTYASDNNGTFWSPRTAANFGTGAGSANPDCARGGEYARLWTKSFDEAGKDRMQDTVDGNVELELALTEGAAYEYIGDISAYKSPLDPTNRLRSYAINAYVGELCPDNLGDKIGDNPLLADGWRAARSLSALPQPNKTLMSICEEDSAGHNNQGFMIKNWFTSSGAPPAQMWFDYPAPWNKEGVTLSFCDGSTEFHTFRKKDLGNFLINEFNTGSGNHRAYYPGEPGVAWDESNSDWFWFKDRMLPGTSSDWN